MALEPWIKNPAGTFTGTATFTQPAWPTVVDTDIPKAPTPGRYGSNEVKAQSAQPLKPYAGWRSTPGPEKGKSDVSYKTIRGSYKRGSGSKLSPLAQATAQKSIIATPSGIRVK
jgi:hypothetical protein